MLLLISRFRTSNIRYDPDLQKVNGLRFTVVELAVGDSATGAHQLDITWSNHRSSAKRVFMLKSTLKHVRENLHVAMGMLTETLPGGNPVVVDD